MHSTLFSLKITNIKFFSLILLMIVSMLNYHPSLMAQSKDESKNELKKERVDTQALTKDAEKKNADSVIITEVKPSSIVFESDEIIYDAENNILRKQIKTNVLQARLKELEQTIPLEFHKNIESFVNYFIHKNPSYTSIMMARKEIYFPLFEKHLKAFGLPEELKYLSIVESGLNPKAISRVGAAGLWQFMPYTGKQFQLNRDFYFDERMDPEQATIAACKYLKTLYNMFGDWPLALAAYNSGPGNVRKAIRRSGYKRNFWQVYRRLPRETRAYVPQFIAVNYALNYGNTHHIFAADTIKQVNRLRNIVTDTVVFNSQIDLATLSKLIDDDLSLISDLNPSMRRSVIPKYRKDFPLVLPWESAQLIKGRRHIYVDSASQLSAKTIAFQSRYGIGSIEGKKRINYRVRSGDVLGKIAQRYRVRVSDLRAWNGIYRNLIRTGQNLKIYVSPNRYSQIMAARKRNTQRKLPVASSKTPITTNYKGQTYKVKSGDTLWEISKKFQGASIESIKKLNNLKSNQIKPGMTLKIG